MLLYRLYISSSVGILWVHNKEIKQKLDCGGGQIFDFQVPKRSPLVYAMCEDRNLKIFNENYSQCLIQISTHAFQQTPRQILIPELQHDNRQLIFLFLIYLIDSYGRVLQFNLIDNKIQPVRTLGSQGSRGDKGVAFRGVSRGSEGLNMITLKNDLKISSTLSRYGASMEKSVNNLKGILEKNRALMSMLEQQTVLVD